MIGIGAQRSNELRLPPHQIPFVDRDPPAARPSPLDQVGDAQILLLETCSARPSSAPRLSAKRTARSAFGHRKLFQLLLDPRAPS